MSLREKCGKILALIDRLQKRKGAVCLFLEKLGVPFDNNQAERNIRNIKTKTKVWDHFRSRTGAEESIYPYHIILRLRWHSFFSFLYTQRIVHTGKAINSLADSIRRLERRLEIIEKKL